MKVNIQYQVDLDDLPGIIKKHYYELMEKTSLLHDLFVSYKDVVLEKHPQEAMEIIEDLEKQMDESRQKLREIGDLYAGYQKALAGQRLNEEAPVGIHPDTQAPANYSPEAAEQYLKQLREQLGGFQTQDFSISGKGEKHD